MTQTAQAALGQTATARADEANMTATARAKQSDKAAADAQATQDALAAAMTATSEAQPTITPTPTSTPEPVAISGSVTDIKGSQLWVKPPDGGDSMPYTVGGDASVMRDGQISNFGSIEVGDKVTLTVDSFSQTVREISATAPAESSSMAGLGKLLIFLPALAVIPLILFIRSRGGGSGVGDAFIVKRVASA
jgi:hypothetical protein